MSAARQMVLDLGWPMAPTMTRAAFVTSESNRAPLAMIDAWESWPSGRLCLTGAAGAGKTHLARIWLEAAGGRALRAETAFDPAAAPRLAAMGRIALEDMDRALEACDPAARPEAERGLFHLFNLIHETGGSLLMTARRAPAHWGAALPDLASRLSATMTAVAEPPDDALLSALLFKLFADRALRVDGRVVDFVMRRMERSFEGAARLVSALDARALLHGGGVTLALARDYFRDMEQAEDEWL